MTGAPYDAIAIKQVNANTFTTTQTNKDGKYRVTGRMVISKDGKTMTTNSKGTNSEGKPISYTMVFDKQ